MDRFATVVDGSGVLTVDTGKITLGPLPIAVGQPGIIPPDVADRVHLPSASTCAAAHRGVRDRRPAVGATSACRPPGRDRASAPVDGSRRRRRPTRHDADARAGRRDRPPVRQRPLGRLPGDPDRRRVRRSCTTSTSVGLPGVPTPRRQLGAEAAAQQVTAVERGYNLFEANCARCHGATGQGGIGPVLNEPDKLFVHLNPDYIRNVLTVGGRYVCGNAEASCRSGRTPGTARPAQLHPDQRPDRVHPRLQGGHVHRRRQPPASVQRQGSLRPHGAPRAGL